VGADGDARQSGAGEIANTWTRPHIISTVSATYPEARSVRDIV
jgi:hypothetical protein